MAENKWKKSTVKTTDAQAKVDARNKVIDLKAQYEAEVPKLEDAVKGLFDFLFRKPELADKYSFTNFDTLKAQRLAEIAKSNEETAMTKFKSMDVQQQKMIKLLYAIKNIGDGEKIALMQDALAGLIKRSDIGEEVTQQTKKDGSDKITFALPNSYKEYFDWFQTEAWAKTDYSSDHMQQIHFLKTLGFMLSPDSYSRGDESPSQLQKEVLTLSKDAKFAMNTNFPSTDPELETVADAMNAVSKMHDSYTTVLTLGELVDNNAPTKPTPSAFEWIKGYFDSFWNKSAKPVEKADSSLFNSKATDDSEEYSEEDNFDAQDEDKSTAVSTEVVEVSIDSTETLTTIHNQYQGFVTQFLTSAKTHCFGKVIATQMLLANCQAYRLSTGKKDLECKNIEATVKIYTDHCEYAFPFGTDEDDYISQELLKAVEIKSGIHSNGILAFTGAGQEYSGFIVDSTKADAKKILGDYVKYVSHHITNEAEVLALPSSVDNNNGAIVQ